jgi:aminopeptidase N
MQQLGLNAGEFATPSAEAHYPPDLEIEPIHIDVDMRVDVPDHKAEGSVTTTVKAARSGPTSLKLHAVDLLDLHLKDVDGNEIHTQYNGREIEIEWAKPFDADEERKIACTYKVESPATGMTFSYPDDAYPDAPKWAATDHETERARHWLPCVDLPNVRTSLSFHLRADKAFTILANGELVKEEEHDDGTKTAHWELKQRCPSYLLCFALGDFTEFKDGEFKGHPLAYYTSNKFKPEDLQRGFGRTGKMLEWMTEKLGSDFPFPKYYQFALEGIGGAMENISLVSWDDMFVLDETLAKEFTWITDQINLHEMAHTWFGDHIVCRDFAHAWLKESWAVYIETLWLEDSKGEEERDYDFYSNMQNYFNEADNSYVRPIVTRTFDHSWKMYDRHLYPGGAARLHMLRHDLGTETFLAGMRDYVNTYGGKTVETDDFRKIMEKHSGKSLVKWFDQWIHGKGYPKLKASFAYDSKKKLGTFTIEQTQVDKKKGVGLFDFSSAIGWTIDGKLQTQQIQISDAKHQFTVAMDSEPEVLRLDPNARTVCGIEFNPGDERLRNQLETSTEVFGRILAANELCKTGKRQNINVVRDAYKTEKFWGVRNRMAEALSKAGTQDAVKALAELIGVETDGMCCETLIRNAGKYRDAAIRQALENFLDNGPKLYRARGAAFEMLGMYRDDAPIDRLAEAAKINDTYGFEQAGALRGLAASRKPEALEVLAGQLKYGDMQTRTRMVGAMALGGYARLLENQPKAKAVETLTDLLRDPQMKARKGAMHGLSASQSGAGIGPLSQFRETLSDQEKVDVDSVIKGLRGSQTPKVGELEKQLEELRKKLMKLEDRVLDVEK